MNLPEVLLRRQIDAYKNMFGHVCIIAGSAQMLGAAALCSISSIRSGAGLVTLAVPEEVNLFAQAKIDNSIMTLPLKQTKAGRFHLSAFKQIERNFSAFDVIAIGPGLGRELSVRSFILKIVENSPIPLVIDADGLNAISYGIDLLNKTKTQKILTPHIGEMVVLTGKDKQYILENKQAIAKDFAKRYNCILLLKGHNTIVASPDGDIYINKTGNPGMATAGSGDVLTGIIAAFLAQGMDGVEAAKYGAYIHGKAGDLAAKEYSRLCMISSDIIKFLPEAFRQEDIK